jgi:hypothetical protein
MRRSDGQMYFDGFKLECFSANSCHMQLSSALAWQSLKFGVPQRTDRWFKYSEADVGVLPALPMNPSSSCSQEPWRQFDRCRRLLWNFEFVLQLLTTETPQQLTAPVSQFNSKGLQH